MACQLSWNYHIQKTIICLYFFPVAKVDAHSVKIEKFRIICTFVYSLSLVCPFVDPSLSIAIMNYFQFIYGDILWNLLIAARTLPEFQLGFSYSLSYRFSLTQSGMFYS